MRWSWMLLAFSSLSFLGFGVAPPAADWGLMISGSRSYMAIAPLAVLAPVVGLSTWQLSRDGEIDPSILVASDPADAVRQALQAANSRDTV